MKTGPCIDDFSLFSVKSGGKKFKWAVYFRPGTIPFSSKRPLESVSGLGR